MTALGTGSAIVFRLVTQTRTRAVETREETLSSTSWVLESAQCRSSRTTTVGRNLEEAIKSWAKRSYKRRRRFSASSDRSASDSGSESDRMGFKSDADSKSVTSSAAIASVARVVRVPVS